MPRGNNELKNVTIDVTPLKDDKGNKLEKVDTDTVGYVKTVNRPPYKVSYVGWWPDPILRGCQNVNIKPRDIQTFWLRFRAGTEQPAGIYTGQAIVKAEGADPADPRTLRDVDAALSRALQTRAEAALAAMREGFGNPSSGHGPGREAAALRQGLQGRDEAFQDQRGLSGA